MKNHYIRAVCFLLFVSLVAGCAAPSRNGAGAEHGLGSVFKGVAHLILSPFQIAAGLLEGISSLPYYLTTNVHEINKGLIEAQASVTLDDTYDMAYGKRLSEVPDSGETGEVFRRMKHASNYFQKVLKGYGVKDPEKYILTSIDTANSHGYTLFAVVYRPGNSIEVVDKYNSAYTRDFARSDRLFYEPFQYDKNGKPLDTVVDWAGLPRNVVKTQKAQALLITMAANAIIDGRVSPEYWEVERRWIDGEFKEIVEKKMSKVRQNMGI